MKVPIRFFMAEVRATDWRRSVEWYRDLLGLRVVLEDAPGQFALLETEGGGRGAIKGGASGGPRGGAWSGRCTSGLPSWRRCRR